MAFQLPDLIFVRTAVELEKRLALLHRSIRLNQHGRNQGRLRQARNKLNRVLNNFQIRRVRGDEAQADDKGEEQMDGKKKNKNSPGLGELEPLELKEHQPDNECEDERDQEREHHKAGRFGDGSSSPWVFGCVDS